MTYYNHEHYHDPTAGQAIANVSHNERRRKRKRRRKKDYFSHQLREIPTVRPTIKEMQPCSKP